MSDPPFVAPETLPIDISDSRSIAWWAMIFILVAQAAILTTFVVAYYYLGASRGPWPPPGIGRPEQIWAVIAMIVIAATAAPAYWAATGIKEGRRGRAALGLAAAFVLGLLFLGIQTYEYVRQDFDLTTNAYASAFLVILGFHAVQTAAALLMTLAVLVWTLLGYYNNRRNLAIQNVALFWYYLIASWAAVFAVLYASPYLIDL